MEAQMNDTGIRAAVARTSADWGGSGVSNTLGVPAEAGVAEGVSSSEIACKMGNDGALRGGLLASEERNDILWVVQLINGLCQSSHEYPRTAKAEWSNMGGGRLRNVVPHRAGRLGGW